MDKTVVKRLAVQTGMVMPYTEDHVAFLDQFAKACCAWQKEQDDDIVRRRYGVDLAALESEI